MASICDQLMKKQQSANCNQMHSMQDAHGTCIITWKGLMVGTSEWHFMHADWLL